MRVLYISQTGMLEGLGRSQVLAYLKGLARRGFDIELMSYEVPGATSDAVAALEEETTRAGIRWSPLRRAADSRLRVKVQESVKGAAAAVQAAIARRPAIVHGRSYFATAVADAAATVVPGAALVFDCRGMIGDEYVDAGYWTKDRVEYKLVKRYERRALTRSEGVVFLTHALARWMDERKLVGPRAHVEIIPTCVDLAEFQHDAEARDRLRKELGLEGTTTIIYSGSLGSWYREDEMARFAGIVRRRATGPVKFLLLTRSKTEEVLAMLAREGFPAEDVVARRLAPTEMAAYLSAGDIGLSFIKSCFSKTGSSPTKVGEYLACGLPVVLNADIGDQADLAEEKETCVVLRSYADAELVAAADRALALAARPVAERVTRGRETALARYDLERVGVARYERLYRTIESRSR